MPTDINTLHIVLTLIAFGILVGAGWNLAAIALVWPGSQITWAVAALCVLIVVLAWAI
ncbi:MAG TPA: hypothetical protein VNM70_09005 [Burkholderiales bacterium]|nr:hypothetical protein [Burkholderiales bacterium]